MRNRKKIATALFLAIVPGSWIVASSVIVYGKLKKRTQSRWKKLAELYKTA